MPYASCDVSVTPEETMFEEDTSPSPPLQLRSPAQWSELWYQEEVKSMEQLPELQASRLLYSSDFTNKLQRYSFR